MALLMSTTRRRNSIAAPSFRGGECFARRRFPNGHGAWHSAGVLAGICLAAGLALADDPPPGRTAAERLGGGLSATNRFEEQLLEAGITPDAQGLAAYLALYQVGPEQREVYRKLLAQLGDDDFHRREDALMQLLRRPTQVADELQAAVRSPDPEVRWRAELVLQQSKQANHDLLYAALLVIRDQKIQGLTAGVLATFPVCRHENRLRFVMGDAFNATATAADADLLRASLQTDDLNLRVMVATALGRTLGTMAGEDLRPLLDDPEDILRVTAAEIMVQGSDPEALRTLGKLLESRHLSIRNRSIQVLRSYLKASLSYSGYDPESVRSRNAARWREAIEEHLRGSVGQDAGQPAEHRRILIFASRRNQLFEIDERGECIALEGIRGAADCRLLADGHRLVTMPAERKVLQIDDDGRTVWQAKTDYRPLKAERLDDGSTLVITSSGDLQEFDASGNLVNQRHFDERLRDVRAAPEGEVLLVTFEPGQILRLDRLRNETWRSPELESPVAVCQTGDGHLIAANSRSGSIVEVDPAGQVRTLTAQFNGPYDLQQLADDRLVVLDWTGLHVIDRTGKSVATLQQFGDIKLE